MRDTIFISHSTPEDNEFTIWLASRLELLGYKTWIDKNELLGGEKFWDNIENTIKHKSIKFLLVYSENICQKSNRELLKNGIQREIDLAKKTMSEYPNLIDYFIILHIDDSTFNLFNGADELNQIMFNSNWADGLTILTKKLVRDQVPLAQNTVEQSSAAWYLKNYIVQNPIIRRKELYYTNWWSIKSLPDYFYIIRFRTEQQAVAIRKKNFDDLIVISSNCLITFKKDLDFNLEDGFGINKIDPSDIFEIKVSELILGYERESFPSYNDASNHFKKLLKRAFHLHLRGLKLDWHELSSKNIAYYHTSLSLPTSKVSFNFPHKKTSRPKKKNLFGKYLNIGKWHFAISVKVAFFPLLGFHIKSHLVFTKLNKIIDSPSLQHSYRRSKGKRMFNEEWRDLLIGFINSLKNEHGVIQVNSSVEKSIQFMDNPEMFWSEFGYIDPKDVDRQNIFIDDSPIDEPENEAI